MKTTEPPDSTTSFRWPGGPRALTAVSTSEIVVGPRKKSAAAAELTRVQRKLGQVHHVMVPSDRSLLVVLQGMDAAGKSGSIRRAARGLDPTATRVAKFDEPTAKEDQEDFLARIRRQLPAPGEVVFFDRSHYEDAVVPLSNGAITPKALTAILDRIRTFERSLVDRGTEIVKVFLHLSYDEQRERFRERVTHPEKYWKFSENDIITRQRWPQIQAAFDEVIGRTSIDEAPWHIVPADRRWYRNWAVASIVAERMASLDLQLPPLAVDASQVLASLEPPN